MGEYLFIASAIFSIVNGSVLLCINPQRLINKALFGTSIWIAAWFLSLTFAVRAGQSVPFESAPVVFWIRASAVVSAFSIWLISLLKTVLLKDSMSAVARESSPWLGVGLALSALALDESFIASTSTPENQQRGAGYIIYILVAVACCTTLLIDALRKMRRLTGVRRIEMQFFVVGTICAFLLVIVSNSLGVLFKISWLRYLSPAWISMFYGATVWAVCYHRVFDAKQIVFSIGQRLLLLGLVGLSALTLNNLLRQFIDPFWSFICTTTIACTASIILDGKTRRWAGLDLQLRLAGPRRQIIDWAREIPNEHELREKFSQFFRDQCQTSVVVFLSSSSVNHLHSTQALTDDWPGFDTLCKDGWTTPETLQRSRAGAGASECVDLMLEQRLGALLAVPKESRPPSLVVGLGQKDGLRPYTFPEIQMLLELAELMDNILTHSRAATQAAHVERMASAAMISRGLAHDLRSLATPVSTFLVHMEDKVAPGAIEAIVLGEAKASLQVMQDYIHESLFFSQNLAPNFALIQAKSLLNDAAILGYKRARDIDVQVILREEAGFTFAGDLALLRRLLQNLVFNAIDASREGGTIELSAKVSDNQHVCLQVTDSGVGIPAEIRSRIFEPYYTTKNSSSERRGLGLGLAICQKIAEVHGGSIAMLPNSPCGTIFIATLPKANAATSVSSSITGTNSIVSDQGPSTPFPTFGPTQSLNGA